MRVMSLTLICSRFAVVYSELVGLYYKPAEVLKEDIKLWVLLFVMLGVVALVTNVLSGIW